MAKKNGEETAMVLHDDNYAIAKFDPARMQEAIQANLEGEEVRATDLNRIKVPSGGSKAFELPSLTGDGEMVKEVQGVIIHSAPGRAYWKTPIDEGGGNQPPDCFSSDGCTGVGNPGGTCKTCPMNVFGSQKKNGKPTRAKACKEMRVAFFLRKTSILPDALIVPPSSITPFKKFKIALTNEGKAINRSVIKVSLREQKNSDGIVYSELVFGYVKELDDESAKQIAAYAETIKQALSGAVQDAVSEATQKDDVIDV